MKIDDIIRKCIEIPGVSIKRSEFNVELLMKTKEGKGSMTFFQLFPGLTIAYIFINSPTWAAPNLGEDSFIKKGPLLLNYCVTGRCEIILNNGNFVYVKDGDISLTECFAQKQYVYPRRIYEGMELFVDTNTLATESTWIQKEFGIDIPKIIELFCPNDNTYISAVTPEVEEILIKLWELFDIVPPFSISQMKIYVLALFSLLQNLNNIPPSQACTFFTETQVDIAKRVEKNYHFRFAATSSCMGIGSSVFCQRNQLKKLFSWRFWSKYFHLSTGSPNEKSCRVTDFYKIVRCRNSRVGRLYESKQICISFQKTIRPIAIGTPAVKKTGKYIR